MLGRSGIGKGDSGVDVTVRAGSTRPSLWSKCAAGLRPAAVRDYRAGPVTTERYEPMTTEKPLIHVVDDDPATLLFIRRTLELNGYRVSATSDGETALDKVETENPDLVLLDVGIPAIDGFEVCRRLRDASDVPVIMVTGKAKDEDVVFGLETGADDYLTKPFSPGVLLARVKALLRRRDLMTNGESVLVCGDLKVDLDARKAKRGDVEMNLTPTEFRLLAHLARNCGKVLTSEQILAHVWGPGYASSVQTLRTHIARLRRKVEWDYSEPTLILTEPWVGYWLDS